MSLATEAIGLSSHLFAVIHRAPYCVSLIPTFVTLSQAQHHDGLITIPGGPYILWYAMVHDLRSVRLRQEYARMCYRRVQDEQTNCYHLWRNYSGGCQTR